MGLRQSRSGMCASRSIAGGNASIANRKISFKIVSLHLHIAGIAEMFGEEAGYKCVDFDHGYFSFARSLLGSA